jgi:hypothetical protein
MLDAPAFLLRKIWESLDLDLAAGVRFAKNDPNVVAFRQLLLHTVAQILRKIGFSHGVCELLDSEHLPRLDALRVWTSTKEEK